MRIEYAESTVNRRVLGRLYPGTELVPGILEICRRSGIRRGYIASLIGSVTRARFVYVNVDRSRPIGISYSPVQDLEGPFEILSAQGMVGEFEDGTAVVHLHALFCDAQDRILGGHMMDSGSPTLATMEIAIQETNDISIVRRHDEETGFPLFFFDGPRAGG